MVLCGLNEAECVYELLIPFLNYPFLLPIIYFWLLSFYMKKSLLFLCIALSAITALAQPKKMVADKILGVVGDRIILQSDIRNTVADIQRQGGQIPENAECAILEQALMSKVLMLQAEKDSLPVTDEDVEARLDLKVREFINVYGSQQALEDVAGKTIYQIKDEARESVREQMLAQAMQEKIVSNVRITPNEVQQFFNKIPVDSLPFFESELEIGHIVIFPRASRDLEKYIIDELNNYKRQIDGKVATFDQLAKRYSEDPGSKDRGGQYQINRTEKTWDPAFMSAAFRLKVGETSAPFKSKFGYHIIQMVERNGDDAIVKHILRIPPITDTELQTASYKLDSVRSKIVAGTMDFSTAAGKFSDDPSANSYGPYMISRDGDTYLTIDELDKELVVMLGKLRVGDISQPVPFTDERGKKGVRLVFLKSRSEPHRMNLSDDYNKISQAALEQKKMLAMEKWLMAKIPTFYMKVDESATGCTQIQKWVQQSKLATR